MEKVKLCSRQKMIDEDDYQKIIHGSILEIPFRFVLDIYLSTDNNSWFYLGDFLFWFVLFCACFFVVFKMICVS